MATESAETIVEALKAWALKAPDKEVFRFMKDSEVYASLTPQYILQVASKFAARLRKYGLTDGDVVGNTLLNSPERLLTDFGILLAGCVTVSCETAEHFSEQFWSTIRTAQCKAILLTTNQENHAFRLFRPFMPDSSQKSGQANVQIDKVQSVRQLIYCHRDDGSGQEVSLLESLEDDESEGYIASPKPDDLATVFVTTGSRGTCLLIPRSHWTILTVGKMFQKNHGCFFNDRPLGWVFSFPYDFLNESSVRVLLDYFECQKRVSAQDKWNVICKAKCETAFLLPQVLLELIIVLREKRPSYKVHTLITGGQPIIQSITGAIGLLTEYVKVIYFATETGLLTSAVVSQQNKTEMKLYYCGMPIKDVELQIVNDEGEQLAPYAVGNIAVKSPTMATSYYNQPGVMQTFVNGFYVTQDRGYVDDIGSLYCFGRAGEQLKLGDVTYYASNIKAMLYHSPDVLRNFVVVVKDREGREKFYACIVPVTGARLSKESMQRYCQLYLCSPHSLMALSTSNNSTSILDHLEFLFFDKLPEAANGKIPIALLKDMIRLRLGFELQPR
ncbi:uncharacterized protein LOC106067430 [Biomphalaria glabrata]|uniref:Uncharacterized protein LOC106067430 n=1 Tax=Biomphalaria glabrata TaxID=6526 RepID=A0A9W3B0Y4_BIOGL|nr:uncharacterized protein LOC106067430 [Biomphalaria glabrata]KAI8757065.1 putative peroxisomal-coenzyme A synthetase [Biomphalaria glabrata]